MALRDFYELWMMWIVWIKERNLYVNKCKIKQKSNEIKKILEKKSIFVENLRGKKISTVILT